MNRKIVYMARTAIRNNDFQLAKKCHRMAGKFTKRDISNAKESDIYANEFDGEWYIAYRESAHPEWVGDDIPQTGFPTEQDAWSWFDTWIMSGSDTDSHPIHVRFKDLKTMFEGKKIGVARITKVYETGEENELGIAMVLTSYNETDIPTLVEVKKIKEALEKKTGDTWIHSKRPMTKNLKWGDKVYGFWPDSKNGSKVKIM